MARGGSPTSKNTDQTYVKFSLRAERKGLANINPRRTQMDTEGVLSAFTYQLSAREKEQKDSVQLAAMSPELKPDG